MMCWHVEELVRAMVQLNPTAQDKRRAREALAGWLARETGSWQAEILGRAMIQLDPTVHDLSFLRAGAVPPVELLTAVRQNSALADWLAFLPSLAAFSV